MALLWAVLSCFALVASSAQDLQSKCSNALTQLGASEQSTQELAARCRATAPLQVCQEMTKALGQRPWGSEDIDATCNVWRKAFELRSLQFKNLPVKKMDDMSEKKELPTYEVNIPGLPDTAENGTTTPTVDAGNDTSDDSSNATSNATVPDATVTVTPPATDTTENATNDTNATAMTDMEGKVELPLALLATPTASMASTTSFVGAGLVLAALAAGAAIMLKRIRSRQIYQSRRSVEDGLE